MSTTRDIDHHNCHVAIANLRKDGTEAKGYGLLGLVKHFEGKIHAIEYELRHYKLADSRLFEAERALREAEAKAQLADAAYHRGSPDRKTFDKLRGDRDFLINAERCARASRDEAMRNAANPLAKAIRLARPDPERTDAEDVIGVLVRDCAHGITDVGEALARKPMPNPLQCVFEAFFAQRQLPRYERRIEERFAKHAHPRAIFEQAIRARLGQFEGARRTFDLDMKVGNEHLQKVLASLEAV